MAQVLLQALAMTSQAYLPFRGLSGWFSCSISPALAQLWGKDPQIVSSLAIDTLLDDAYQVSKYLWSGLASMHVFAMHDAIVLYHSLYGLRVCNMHTDSYGGTLAGEDEASYLFSDDATAKDTIR